MTAIIETEALRNDSRGQSEPSGRRQGMLCPDCRAGDEVVRYGEFLFCNSCGFLVDFLRSF